ncbi:MAG: RHS repeat protein [Candidatus Contendobacter sp.]|nr:RHS repeat protein [Candidatus Contendobacter sp.]
MQSPITTSHKITTGGRTATVTAARAVTLTNPSNLLSLSTLTDSVTVNGRTATTVYDAATRTATATSPAGRASIATLDGVGRMIRAEAADLLPVEVGYDAQGRLATVSQGGGADARTLGYAYNPQGYLASVTDPFGRQVRFDYDLAGRVTTQTLPDGRQILYGYDAKGNLTALTPPGQPAHLFRYTAVDQTEEYAPPDVGAGSNSTVYTYDPDKALSSVARPDGQTVAVNHDSAGRVSSLVLQPGNRNLASYAYTATGKLGGITAPDGGLSYAYSGALLTQTQWTGAVAGNIGYSYDNDFRVASVSLNGANPITYSYDNDSLLTQAGSLTLNRDARNGRLTGTVLGSLADSYGYNAFGELSAYEATQGATSHLKLVYTRDKLGRITRKEETRGGATHAYDYGYDPAGRLVEVKKDGVAQATYGYDANGNRLSKTGPGGNETGSYDAQDRLLTYDGASYTYTANGELKTKTRGGQTTQYDYDVLGNLKKVTLPDGTVIDYLTDGRNRRIGKKVNGTLTQGFLWQSQLQPIAELDGSGNVVSRFVYATGVNVPDYLIKGGSTYRIIKDHLGSPHLVVDAATNTVVQEMAYDEFGKVLTDSNPGFQPFGFAGGLYDLNTGLVRFGARDYEAETGRWTAKDPIHFLGGDSNIFAYSFAHVGKWMKSQGG